MSSGKRNSPASASSAGKKKARLEENSSGATPQTEDTKQEKEISVDLEDFPVHSKNPFKTPFCRSDIVLIVEGRKLHAHRQILSVYSHFFRDLLGSQGWKEDSSEEFKLEGNEAVEMKYDTMVEFLLHLYPVHSASEILDYETLKDLFPLAAYFQCQHVRTKCESFVSKRLHDDEKQLGVIPLLRYLCLCAQCDAKGHVIGLLDALSRNRSSNVVEKKEFQALSPENQSKFYKNRVLYLERELSELNYAACSLFSLFETNCTCKKCRASGRGCHIICQACGGEFKGRIEKLMK